MTYAVRPATEADLDRIAEFEIEIARISFDDVAFREVFVDYGTLVWPGNVDLAPETLIWDGPYPSDGNQRPEPFLRPSSPSGSAG